MRYEDDEFLGVETSVLDEDEDLLNEDQLDSLDPWEIAFEQGVKQAEQSDVEDWEDDFE